MTSDSFASPVHDWGIVCILVLVKRLFIVSKNIMFIFPYIDEVESFLFSYADERR